MIVDVGLRRFGRNGLSLSAQVAALFSAGEQGAWYDPSDFSTMFQDEAGSIPVTAVGQAVGRILDKSGSGNHATQSTSTKRPVLSARVNLLTNTEQFEQSPWTGTPTVSGGISHNGVSIQKLTNAATNAFQLKTQTVTTSTATTFEVTAYASFIDAPYVVLFATDGVANGLRKGFNVSNGTVGATQTIGSGWALVSSSITLVAAGVYRLVMRVTNASSTRLDVGVHPALDADGTTSSNSGKSNYVGGFDVRPSNDGIGQPAYQRVNTSTDYDTVGFKPYLRFDGIDDALQTASINFTGTDNVTVWAGVRKLSDATQIAMELSSSSFSTDGSFSIRAPTVANGSYEFTSRGTVFATANTIGFPTPITNTIIGTANISGDMAQLRINNVVVNSAITDQGTGDYGNHPLYIGSRGGTTLPFNGRLYSLIVRGAQSTATQISTTENYVNSRTGAY